jgi:hypothetical protein
MTIIRYAAALLTAWLAWAPQYANADILEDRLTALRKAADCEDKASLWRVWCIAGDFQRGTADGGLPSKVLVGYTVRLEDGANLKVALRDQVTLAAFVAGPEGKVLLVDIKPSSKSEETEVFEAISQTTIVFKDRAKVAPLPKGLRDYLRTLQGRYHARNVGQEWEWAGMSNGKLRKVGNYWVVIETPKAQNGIFATILTDAWQ